MLPSSDTGQSIWIGQKIAARLVSDPERDVFRVQFHPSYGYEDLVEGFTPDEANVLLDTTARDTFGFGSTGV